MKTCEVNVTELKARLSKYLRLASHGTRITVKDRDEPIAELGPLQAESLSWHDRLAREGRLRRGTQNWEKLKISKLERRVDIQASLRAVREDPHEVRRR
jgi:antitoxin (DNA-binding transcriptional repressor) of toxin-antitoxin stability system